MTSFQGEIALKRGHFCPLLGIKLDYYSNVTHQSGYKKGGQF